MVPVRRIVKQLMFSRREKSNNLMRNYEQIYEPTNKKRVNADCSHRSHIQFAKFALCGQRGFTLIETLVALVLITVAMGPVFILATSSVNVASRIEHNLIASNLAQEGIEVIRNIRDTNWTGGAAFDNNLPAGVWRVQWDTVGGGLMA